MFNRLFIVTHFVIVVALSIGAVSAWAIPSETLPLASAVSTDGQCRAVLALSPEKPFLADTIILTLTVTCPDTVCPGDVPVEFPPFGERLGELNIVDIKTTNRQLILTAIPQRAGKTPIWAMTIRCGQEQIDLPAIELDIAAEIDCENASLDDIGLLAQPIPQTIWYIYAIAIPLVLVALILLWLFLRRRKAEPLVESASLSAQEIALRRLADLLESQKHATDVKGFFVELSDIVRWYVERLTGIRAPELTTEEFLHKIAEPSRRYWEGSGQQSAHLAGTPIHYAGSLTALAPFLESADIVKFAKHVPTTEEMMLAFRRADNFIREE